MGKIRILWWPGGVRSDEGKGPFDGCKGRVNKSNRFEHRAGLMFPFHGFEPMLDSVLAVAQRTEPDRSSTPRSPGWSIDRTWFSAGLTAPTRALCDGNFNRSRQS